MHDTGDAWLIFLGACLVSKDCRNLLESQLGELTPRGKSARLAMSIRSGSKDGITEALTRFGVPAGDKKSFERIADAIQGEHINEQARRQFHMASQSTRIENPKDTVVHLKALIEILEKSPNCKVFHVEEAEE